MKKIISLLLVAALACSMTACGNEKPTDSNNSNTSSSVSDTSKGSEKTSSTKVSVFWYEESDVYLSTVRDALNKALDSTGIKYDNQFAGNDQSKQIDQIRTAIAGGSNLLVVNLVTSGATDTAEDIINIAGDIPVIFFNRGIGKDGSEIELLNKYQTACFIGTDSPEAGHMQGKMIGEYIMANYDEIDVNKDGVISYAMFKGEEGNDEAIYRTQFGVEDANKILASAGKPEMKYFDENNSDKYQVDQAGKWSATAAKEYMDTNFITYNEDSNNMIELIICNNDGMAEGAIASLQEKGYNKDGGHIVPVFGVDATENAKALIKEGAMTGTVKQDKDGMAAAICGTIEAIANGKSPVDALASINDERLSISSESSSKLFVAYAPYTGE